MNEGMFSISTSKSYRRIATGRNRQDLSSVPGEDFAQLRTPPKLESCLMCGDKLLSSTY